MIESFFHKCHVKIRSWVLHLVAFTAYTTFALIVKAPVHAEIVDCSGVTTTSGYKILLDELSYSRDIFSSDNELRLFLERLRFKLQTKLESLRLEETTRLNVLQCRGRRPVDESEFSRGIVDALNSRDVLIEVWGTLDANVEDHEIRDRVALIGYAVIPVRYYENASATLPGIYIVRYSKQSFGPTKAFLDMLGQAIEFDAFTAVAFGVKSFKVHNYDQALQYLCKADILLNESTRQPSGESDPKRKALIAYVRRVAGDCVSAARADPNYQGAIRLLLKNGPCPKGQ